MFTASLILFLAILQKAAGQGAVSAEANITRRILQNYVRTARPVRQDATAVNVTLDVAFNQLVDIDEQQQIMTSSFWLRVRWYDELLMWNATEEGVASIFLSYEDVWMPDLTLYNNAHDEVPLPVDKNVVVFSDGLVMWLQPAIIKSQCTLDGFYFPYDIQSCPLKFGSWSYHGLQFDIHAKRPEGDISEFIPNGAWELVKMPAVRIVRFYGCCPEPFPTITYYIVLRRLPLFYMFQLFLPCVLFSVLSLTVFHLPCDSGEKTSLAVTMLLSLTVFMLVANEYLPPSSKNIPIIAQYFMGLIILIGLCLMSTVITLHIHHRGDFGRRAAPWLRRLTLTTLAPRLCLRSLGNSKTKGNKYHLNKFSTMDTTHEVAFRRHSGPLQNGFVPTERRGGEQQPRESDDTASSQDQLHKYLASLNRHLETQETEAYIETEWNKIAATIDRLNMIIFAVLCLVLNIITLIRFYTNDENPVPEHTFR